MKKTIIGKHTGPLFCMDMACKFTPPGRSSWYGHGFAIGDRAWTHVWILDWRARHPDARLILTDRTNANPQLQSWAGALDAAWLGDGIADELWETSYQEEPMPRPRAYPLYHAPMGRIWKWLRRNKKVMPRIRPKPAALARAAEVLAQYKVPSRFITLQPLWDASYNTYRNAPPQWWQAVCERLAAVAPVVLVGAHWNAAKMSLPKNTFPIWRERLSSMETLAIISKATVHVGGETGMTIWAPIFKIPTIAVYRQWDGWEAEHLDVRPIPFGAPVVHAQLLGDPATVARRIGDLRRVR